MLLMISIIMVSLIAHSIINGPLPLPRRNHFHERKSIGAMLPWRNHFHERRFIGTMLPRWNHFHQTGLFGIMLPQRNHFHKRRFIGVINALLYSILEEKLGNMTLWHFLSFKPSHPWKLGQGLTLPTFGCLVSLGVWTNVQSSAIWLSICFYILKVLT